MKKKPAFLGIIVLLVVLYFFKGQFVVALVNNRPIWRRVFVKTLEKQGGQQVLDSLIIENLILQAAQKEGISISDEAVNQEIEKIKANFSSQGQDFDQLLAAQGISQKELAKQIEIQKTAELIAGKNISVSDEEVANYLTENEISFSEEENQDEAKANVKRQLEQEKLNQAIQEWLDLLRENANIKSFL